MTTIAYKNGILAGDKQAQYGTFAHAVTKIRKLQDGSLAGGSGEIAFIGAMLDWLEQGADAARFPATQRDKEDWQPILHVTTQGEIRIYERTPYPVVTEGKFFAIGSGRDFAIMAMRLGKSAPEAVELAAEFDRGTGMGVDTLSIPQPLEAWRITRLESVHSVSGGLLLQRQQLQEPGGRVPGRA